MTSKFVSCGLRVAGVFFGTFLLSCFLAWFYNDFAVIKKWSDESKLVIVIVVKAVTLIYLIFDSAFTLSSTKTTDNKGKLIYENKITGESVFSGHKGYTGHSGWRNNSSGYTGWHSSEEEEKIIKELKDKAKGVTGPAEKY